MAEHTYFLGTPGALTLTAGYIGLRSGSNETSAAISSCSESLGRWREGGTGFFPFALFAQTALGRMPNAAGAQISSAPLPFWYFQSTDGTLPSSC